MKYLLFYVDLLMQLLGMNKLILDKWLEQNKYLK